MSQWIHVSGIVRIDSLPVQNNLENIMKSFTEGAPSGSEGGLEFNFWKNPEVACLAAFTVSFWGDLRNFEDPEIIIKWLRKAITNRIIRSLVVHIDIEFKKHLIVSKLNGTDFKIMEFPK